MQAVAAFFPKAGKVKLVEKDHGYNPAKAKDAYNELNDVLFIGTSFGTPNTLPLHPSSPKTRWSHFPASLSSAMAGGEWTPPVGTPYKHEAMRAVDYMVESAGGADKVKAAIIYDQTDYGKDGFEGFKAAAAAAGVTVVFEQAVAPGKKDFTAVVGALKQAGASHVLLTVLASSTGPILGTAAKMRFPTNWIGQTPSWIDPFLRAPTTSCSSVRWLRLG